MTARHLLAVLVLISVWFRAERAPGAGLENYLSPPGSLWGVLLETNASAKGLCAIPGGFVLSGTKTGPVGPDLDFWGLLARLSESGAVLTSTNFHYETDNTGLYAAIPAPADATAPEGFTLAGWKHHHSVDPTDPRREWDVPWMWLVRVDSNFARVWDHDYGAIGYTGMGQSLLRSGSEWMLGGYEAYADGAGPAHYGWLRHLNVSGEPVASTNLGGSQISGVRAIQPAHGGGFVVATGRGLVKVNDALELVWRAGDTPFDSGYQPDAYQGVRACADGTYLAVGTRCHGPDTAYESDLILTRFLGNGTVVWTAVFGEDGASADSAADLLLTADGGCVVLGTTASYGHGGSDVWLFETDATGNLQWDLLLGGEGNDRANALVLAADGNYVIAADAEIGSSPSTQWVLKIGNNPHVPVPSFTFAPASPVFRDQVITFDASASVVPGGSILSYEWNFGDGATANGVNSTRSYLQPGIYTVTLTVGSNDGVKRSAMQDIEVSGLVLQWERYYGLSSQDATSLLGTPDGGYLLAGNFSSSFSSTSLGWVLKLDRRGRVVWEKSLVSPDPANRSDISMVRGAAGGYIIAGGIIYGGDALGKGFYLKLDEDGNYVWPWEYVPGVFSFLSLAPTADGGCIMAGYSPTNSTHKPTLAKVNGAGTLEWNRCYPGDYRHASRVAPLASGEYLSTFEHSGSIDLLVRFDSLGIPIATNSVGYRQNINSMAERPGHPGQLVAAGAIYDNIMLRFYETNGSTLATHTWTGPASYDQPDVAHSMVFMPDGGYLLVGKMLIQPSTWGFRDDDVALVRTDAEGNELWVEMFPGGTNHVYDQWGMAAVAVTNGFVLLGTHNSSQPPAWVFKLGRNHAPAASMSLSTNVASVGASITFDGRASSDRDGEVVSWEWEFGDGTTAQGQLLTHSYTNSGRHVVRFTAVDDADAERSATNEVFVTGVVETDGGFSISGTVITESPESDPTFQPAPPVPVLMDWRDARGIQLIGVATVGSSKTFQVTFNTPVPSGLVLYQLPGGEVVRYTILDKHTIEFTVWRYAGTADLRFVLGKAYRSPRIANIHREPGGMIGFTVPTESGCLYRVRQSSQLQGGAWVDAQWSPSVEGSTRTTPIEGTGSDAAVFIPPPAADAFIRLELTLPP